MRQAVAEFRCSPVCFLPHTSGVFRKRPWKMKTFHIFSAFFLLIFTDVCSAEVTGTPKKPEVRGFCSKCPKLDRPVDCAELMKNGVTTSGVYTIYPRSRLLGDRSIDVYCDMKTNGGGWTLIQRRGQFGNPEDYFVKTWNEYKDGFGDLTKEFWIGNTIIYSITNQGQYAVRFQMKHENGTSAYAQYENFWIDNEENKYKLRLSEYSGNAGDAIGVHAGRDFYTIDQPNKESDHDNTRSGGWWVNWRFTTSLNGLNLYRSPKVVSEDGITWWSFGGFQTSMESTEIKVRPKKFH